MFIIALLFYIVFGIAIFVFIEVAITFVILYVENKLNTHLKVEMPDKPSLTTLMMSFLVEWPLTMIKHFTFPLNYFKKETVYEGTGKQCIVLIHGYGRNRYDWWWFKRNISVEDSVVFTVDLSLARQSLEESTNELTEKLFKLKKSTGCDELILLGHSLGGVISSMAVENNEELKAMVSKVVAICSPFHGTKIAAFIPSIFNELQPNAKVLLDAAEKIRQSTTEYLLFVSCCDHIVMPWDSPLIESVPHEVVFNKGHIKVLYSKQVLDKITNFITAPANTYLQKDVV